jgi:hypothetical protein
LGPFDPRGLANNLSKSIMELLVIGSDDPGPRFILYFLQEGRLKWVFDCVTDLNPMAGRFSVFGAYQIIAGRRQFYAIDMHPALSIGSMILRHVNFVFL